MSALKYWLWLTNIKGIGNLTALRLLDQFGTPENVYYADDREYRFAGWLSDHEIRALSNKKMDRAEKILEDCERLRLRIVTVQDAKYPDRLKNIYSAPCVFYFKGREIEFDEEVAVAVVGSRSATPYGLFSAERISFQMARGGAIVVSGLARGIDSAGHRGALRAGAPTAAVLGCGIDVIYPPENRELYEDILSAGVIISEYPPGTPALGSNFPARNRIISGLSLGVVIVEAPEHSGALITAAMALEQGRDLFAVPGNIDAPSSVGSNNLIKEGACLVSGGWDVLREYQGLFPHKIVREALGDPAVLGYGGKASDFERKERKVAQPTEAFEIDRKKMVDNDPDKGYIDVKRQFDGCSEQQMAIIETMAQGPLHIDEIVTRTGLPAQKVLSELTVLELQGIITQLGGKMFRLGEETEA